MKSLFRLTPDSDLEDLGTTVRAGSSESVSLASHCSSLVNILPRLDKVPGVTDVSCLFLAGKRRKKTCCEFDDRKGTKRR